MDHECFMIMAGRKATVDGSVLVGHDDDLRGHNAALMEKLPPKDFDQGETVRFPSGLKIPREKHWAGCLILRAAKGYDTGDAIAVNEHQVSIAGGVALEKDRNDRAREADPSNERGVTGLVRYVALAGAKTARECAQRLGALYSRYGVAYCSGVAMADAREIWYMEAGGGTTWAAVRIPDEVCWPQANGYRIGTVAPDDGERFMCSEGLLHNAKTWGLWDPAKEPFHFARAFGGKRDRNPGEKYFNSRRVWGCLRLLCPSLALDPFSLEFPLETVPERKIGLKDLFRALRDHYEGTEFDTIACRGPRKERAIAVSNCVHTSVVQLRDWLAPDVGGVLWAGLSTPSMTPFVPFYSGITEIPKAYGTAEERYDPDSAFWTYRTVANLVNPHHSRLIGMVLPEWEAMEDEALALQPAIDKSAVELLRRDPALARKFMTTWSCGRAHMALERTRDIIADLHTKIAEESYQWKE